MCLNVCAGSVKDSVVGEERIARYLLAVLNTRGTPLHWKHWNNRKMDGIQYESEEKHKYDPKDLRPNRRKPPSVSDVVYVEVTKSCRLSASLSIYMCVFVESRI
jgi:hypothetical protein